MSIDEQCMHIQRLSPEQTQHGSKTIDVSEQTAINPLLLTIPQVAQQLGLSPAKVYHLIALERLPTVKFGRAVRVPYGSLIQWLRKREQEQQS